jgi:clan AA aspartic protease
MLQDSNSPITKITPAPQRLEDIMGLTHVTVALSNPGDRTRKWEGLFLVDTGAIDSMAPAKALREIGILPEGTRSYELADGKRLQFEYGIARIEFMGDLTSGDVIFGPDDCEPLLGVTALEHTGIVVDPKTNQLRRLPAVPLK